MSSGTVTGAAYRAIYPTCNIFGAKVLSVTWRIDAQANIAEIELPKKRFHEFRQHSAGKSVYIKASGRYIFQGWITGRAFSFSPDAENVTLVAQGPRWMLQGDFIKGQLILNSDGVYAPLIGLRTIFNEKLNFGGKTRNNNASNEKTSGGTFDGVRPFSLDPLNASISQAFTVSEMVYYIYTVGRLAHDPAIVDNCLTMSEFAMSDNVGNLKPHNINVDGTNITSAINAVMKMAGLRWWCRPISSSRSELRAFIAGPGANTPEKKIYLANVMDGSITPPTSPLLANIGSSNNNLEAGQSQEDFADVATRIHAYGAPKSYQLEFELTPGWDADLWATLSLQEDNIINKNLSERSCSKANWQIYKDIGRKWILDEDGSISGEAYDFNDLFNTASWCRRRRPFLGTLPDGANITQAEAWRAGVGDWFKINMSAQILQDQGGIYFGGGDLEWPLRDCIENTLATKIRITLAVPEDWSLNKIAQNEGGASEGWQVGIIGGGDEDVDRRLGIIVDTEYQTDNMDVDREQEVSDNLEDFVIRKLKENRYARLSSSFSIPWITCSYEPGDKITKIVGRNIKISAQIAEVRLVFGEQQRTELILEDMRMAES